MAKNITLMGANYQDVPAVDLPKTGGGTARFVDPDGIVKTVTEAITTDAYRWLNFPSGRTILDARIGTNVLILAYNVNVAGKYSARTYTNAAAGDTNPLIYKLEVSTEYTVTYTYI